MYKKIISAVFLMLFLSIPVFSHSATIQISGENKYKAIRLTPELYNHANSDLSDILIKGSSDERCMVTRINCELTQQGKLNTEKLSEAYASLR